MSEIGYPETDRGGGRSPAPSAAGLRTMVIVNRRNVEPDEQLRRRVATDAIPDAVSIDDTIGATLIDDRYFAMIWAWPALTSDAADDRATN